MWNPWRGCRRYSEGCRYCYIHKGDAKRGIDTGQIIRTEDFSAPVEKNKKGEYVIKAGQTVFLCFSSDFLIEEADGWRAECWEMMARRPDLDFIFLTKRINRFPLCVPDNWGSGYGNVTVGCTVENQRAADERLPLFSSLPIRHRNVICQPLIEAVYIQPYLGNVELVVAGGESDRHARPLDYAWVLSLRQQCENRGVRFEFRQCGTHFIRDGRKYIIRTRDLCSQARKAGINL